MSEGDLNDRGPRLSTIWMVFATKPNISKIMKRLKIMEASKSQNAAEILVSYDLRCTYYLLRVI